MAFDRLKSYLKEYSYLKSFQSLLYWDMETMMPKGAIEDRAERLSYIQGKLHQHLTQKKYQSLLKDLESMELSPLEKKLLKELKWDFEISRALPPSHVKTIAREQALASHSWAKCKVEGDWESFRPQLQRLIDLKRREISFYDTKKPYDALLRLYDKEFTSTEISRLFNDLKIGLEKLTTWVKSDGRFVNVTELKPPFDEEAQRKISVYVAQLFGLPEKHSRLDVSSHPFSINISPSDQRITTRYSAHNLDSLGSTMHEVGHALYELNLPRSWEGTPFQESISLSVHESQSRFWENIIGRSREFCRFLHPKMKEIFPSQMKGVDEERLFLIFNKSVPGLIRVESSELYYNYHVIIRYEIEEQIFNHGLDAEDIPQLWAQKYRDYLGVSPEDAATGVLQDSHWAGAVFGYFPTYTLGNLMSGILHQKMKREVKNFSLDVGRGDFSGIGNYLKDLIHSKGRSVSGKDIFGEIEVNDYLSYLGEKFRGQ
jgi:carboxypeptidase Taq